MNSVTAFARRSSWRALIAAACFGSSLVACTNAADPAPGPAITELTGPLATLSVPQGFFTKSLILIKRSSTFDGVVQLAAEGLPTGMLVSFAPVTISSVGSVSEITISALATLSPGAHSFTVRASGPGVESKTLTVSVMVTVPTFTVASGSTSANVAQGGTLAIPITITRDGGFTGPVGLAVPGLPTGVTATFSPASIESDATTSTLTFAAPLTALTGVTTVNLRASAQGFADKTIPIVLTVGPATAPAILLSANPVFLEVERGHSIETALTLQRFAGFGGVVNVSVDGLPATLTATADPFAAGSNTTTLRIAVSALETGLKYDLTVRANGVGVQEASTRIAVQTRLQSDFGLTFAGGGSSVVLPINRGASATLPLSINRVLQFSAPITLTFAGAPSGVTANLPTAIPSSTTAQAFDVVISVAADAVPGTYTVQIRGDASGINHNAVVLVQVR